MAIKIAGTTVVDNSRGLTNIATVDATTATAIGSAGVGGGGTHDFVASGAISNGDIVVLNSDGTVSIPSYVNPSVISKSVIDSSNYASGSSSVYDSNSNKIVVVYNRPTNSNYYAVVGTIDGSSISFGTPVVFDTSSNGTELSLVFDSNANKVVAFYRDTYNSDYGTAVVGTVSGTTISFGTPVVFNTATTSAISAVFDSNANKIVATYKDAGSSGFAAAKVGTVSGTTISFGTAVIFETGSLSSNSSTFDSSANKVVIAYSDGGNSGYGTSIVGTVSGTSITFGTAVVFNSANTSNLKCTFDSNSNKVVVAYRDFGNSLRGVAIVGAVDGTTISFGTEVVFETGHTLVYDMSFDNSTNRIIIAYTDVGNNYNGTFVVGTVSGTSISYSSPVVFQASTNTLNISSAFESGSNKVVIAYTDGSNSNYLTNVLVDPGQSTATDYIGIAAEDISDTATGEITINGGVANVGTFSSYDIANASYDSVSFSFSSQSNYPQDVAFDSSGTKMYILERQNKIIYQYALSTAWDVSTASYGGTSFTIGLVGIIYGIAFSPDGTKLFMLDNSFGSVRRFSLSSAWNVSTASDDSSSYSVYSQVSGAQAITFSPDGTKMFVAAGNGSTIFQYTLSTAFDLSAVSYSGKSLDTTPQEAGITDLVFNGDGTKLFILHNRSSPSKDRVIQYSLSTAYDVSTASYGGVDFNVRPQETTPTGLAFSSNGTEMYVVGIANDTVFQYSTGSAPTTNLSYFVANNGTFTTTNNGRKIGKAISSTELQVKTKLTGSEMNEYLGGLV